MFSPHSPRKRVSLRKALLPLFLFCLVLGASFFSACNHSPPGPNVGGLEGTWSSGTGDGYIITDSTMIYTSDWGYGFEGIIWHVEYYTADSGVIIVEYTVPPTAYTPPGNFQGVYFKELKANSVILGSAYTAADLGATPVEVATLNEAMEKFKLDTIALYGGELTSASPQYRQ